MHIRPASLNDIAELAHLHHACFKKPWGELEFAQFFERDNILSFLATMQGGAAPCGFIFTWIVADQCELLALGVNKDKRGKGMGRALLIATIDALKESNISSLFLEVGVTNKAAQQLYLSQGFTMMGRRKNYYDYPDGSREDAVTMRLEVDRL